MTKKKRFKASCMPCIFLGENKCGDTLNHFSNNVKREIELDWRWRWRWSKDVTNHERCVSEISSLLKYKI